MPRKKLPVTRKTRVVSKTPVKKSLRRRRKKQKSIYPKPNYEGAAQFDITDTDSLICTNIRCDHMQGQNPRPIVHLLHSGWCDPMSNNHAKCKGVFEPRSGHARLIVCPCPCHQSGEGESIVIPSPPAPRRVRRRKRK